MMRPKRSANRCLNLALVAILILCLTVVRPARSYAGDGPCHDAAQAALTTELNRLSALYDIGREDWVAARQTAIDNWAAAQQAYETAKWPLDLALDGALVGIAGELAIKLAFISGAFYTCVGACGIIGVAGVTPVGFLICSDACIEVAGVATAQAMAIAAEKSAVAYGVYYIAMIPLNNQLAADAQTYQDDLDAADADMFAVNQYTESDGPRAAYEAYDADIAACPDPDDYPPDCGDGGGDGGDGGGDGG